MGGCTDGCTDGRMMMHRWMDAVGWIDDGCADDWMMDRWMTDGQMDGCTDGKMYSGCLSDDASTDR